MGKAMEDTNTPQGTGDSLDQAATAFLNVIDPETDTEDREEQTAGEQPSTEDSDAGAEQAQPETEDAQPADPEELLYEIDGKEVTLSEIREWQKGQLRQQDYTRKTQETAQQRKVAEDAAKQAAAERQAIAQERQRYAQILQSMQAEPEQEPDWQKMAEEDPLGYIEAKANWDAKQNQQRLIQAERVRVQQLQQQEYQAQQAKFVEGERAKLLEALPDWGDKAKADTEGKAIAEFLGNSGYSKEELSQLYDHRALLVARKAMLYDQLMSKQPEVEKKVKAAPKVQKPGTRRSKEAVKGDKRDAMRQKLKRSGSVDDAAALFLEVM